MIRFLVLQFFAWAMRPSTPSEDDDRWGDGGSAYW